jgi:hypothetical protein
MLSKTGRKRMSEVIIRPPRKSDRPRTTLSGLQAELAALRERVEDLEDLRELNEAIERNAGKKAIPWEKARKELGLED